MFDEMGDSEYIRRDGVSDFILERAKAMYGKTVNKEDSAVIVRIYKTLSYPLTLTEYDETTSWQGALFDHAPVVAAAAIPIAVAIASNNFLLICLASIN